MDNVTIASTTDTAEQVHAAVNSGEPPAEEQILGEVDATTGEPVEKPAEKKAEAKTDEKAAEKAEKVEEKAEVKTDDDKQTRPEKRIAKLTAEKYSQMRRAEQLEARVKELQAQLEAKPKAATEATERPAEGQAQPADEPEPAPDKFKTYEDYVKALGEWSAKKTVTAVLAAERQKWEADQQQTQAAEAQTRFDETRAEAADRYSDFEEVMASDVAQALPITEPMQYVLMNNALGHDIAYYLVKNPQEAETIAKLQAPDQVFAMGQLASKVQAVLNGKKGAAAKAEKTTEKKPVSAAPPPIEPVGAYSTTSTVEEDKMPFREWADKRNRDEQERRKKRR